MIDSVAMPWFSQNRFMSYKMMNDSRMQVIIYDREKQPKKSEVRGREQWANGNSQSMSASRMALANDSTNFMKSSAVSDVFIVLLTFLARFWLAIAKVIPIAKWLSFALRACHLWNISPRPLQTVVQLEQCTFYQGSRCILSRRQHAPNKQCALNNDVTRFYGI